MIGPRKVDRPLVLYGYGKLGHLAEEIFTELGIPVYRKIDKDSDLSFDNIPIGKALVAVCVASKPFAPIEYLLAQWGFNDVVPVWDILEYYADRTGIRNGWFVGSITQEDADEISFVLSTLNKSSLDDGNNYLAFILWHQGRHEQSYFLTPGISLPSTLADIRDRQSVRVFSLPGDADFHNEGCELESLKLNMGLLKINRPQISVACYHSRDGLWRIEKFLMDNLEDYTWTFRLTAYMGQGAYIYGTPNERR